MTFDGIGESTSFSLQSRDVELQAADGGPLVEVSGGSFSSTTAYPGVGGRATFNFGSADGGWNNNGGHRIRITLSNLRNGARYRVKYNLIGTDGYGNTQTTRSAMTNTQWLHPQNLPSMTFPGASVRPHDDTATHDTLSGNSGASVQITFNGGQMQDLFEFSSAGGAGGQTVLSLPAVHLAA